jgi:hypothetical protein
MARYSFFVAILAVLFGAQARALPGPHQDSPADWTIMVFMNGKNNLEPAALTNFLQMAQIGSTGRVNIIVELGRPQNTRYSHAEGDWTGVLRFRVTKGMHPVPSSAINPDDVRVRNADMGSGKTLADFVQWSEGSYPAKRNMLLIWNHGQGWRLYLANVKSSEKVMIASKYVTAVAANGKKPAAAPADKPLTGGYRSVSFDDDTKHFLYNRDIEDSLHGQNLDVIGFDACLMAMMESAYAFRNIAKLMVASEELVPGDGWKYNSWLHDLVANSSMDETALGKTLVQSYKSEYGDTGNMTLSAVDLTKVKDASQSLTNLSSAVTAKLESEEQALAFARQSSQNFGDWYQGSWQSCQGSDVLRFHGIDLDHFLDSYSAATQDGQIKNAIVQVRQKLASMIISSYASSSAGGNYGSTGLAIYFPRSLMDYQCDSDGDGYNVDAVRTGRVLFPPEFVQKETWANLIQAYLLSKSGSNAQKDF